MPSHQGLVPSRLFVRLFGPPLVSVDGARILGFRIDRILALFSYLAVSPSPVDRGELSLVLWGDRSPSLARANLSSNLYLLEKRLFPHLNLRKNKKNIFMVESPTFVDEPVDVRKFFREDPPAGCEVLHPASVCPSCKRHLESLLEMSEAPFLEELPGDFPREFIRWVGDIRSRVNDRRCQISKLLEENANGGDVRSSASLPPGQARRGGADLGLTGTLSWERRQITLVGLLLDCSPEIDLEDRLALLSTVKKRASALLGEVEGVSLETHDLTFLAVFGYPIAQEDAVHRALRLARESLAQWTQDARTKHFWGKVHLGIALHAGEGIVDRSQGSPHLAGERVREIVGILRGAREKGIIATYDAVVLLQRSVSVMPIKPLTGLLVGEGRFLYHLGESLPSPQIEGVFVGRGRERRDLWVQFENLQIKGFLGFVLVSGEPGIGKTALVRDFLSRVRAGSPKSQIREYNFYSEYQKTPWGSVIRILREKIGLTAELSLSEKLYRTERYLLSVGQKAVDSMPLLLHFLEGNGPWSEEIEHLSSDDLRAAFENLLLSILTGLTADPAVLVVEDFHWADGASRQLLEKVFIRLKGCPLMVLMTARKNSGIGRDLESLPRDPDLRIDLRPLTRSDSRKMIESLVSAPLPVDMMMEGLDRGAGIPFFLRELCRSEAFLARGKRLIPSTIQDLLNSRIDALGESRLLVQVAACLGQSIDRTLLLSSARSVVEETGQPFDGRLWIKDLLVRGILAVDRPEPDVTYEFHHALMRDAILNSLTRSFRQSLHRVIASVIQKEFLHRMDAEPETLAFHLEEAGEVDDARQWWRKAAERAKGLGAYDSALEYYQRALDLIEDSGRGADSFRLETLLSMLVLAGIVWGYASPRIDEIVEKLREALSRVEDPTIGQHIGMIEASLVVGGMGPDAALERLEKHAGEGDSLPGAGHDSVWFDIVSGNALFWKGDLLPSRNALERAREIILGTPSGAGGYDKGEHPLLHAYTKLAFVSQFRGEIEASDFYLYDAPKLADLARSPRGQAFLESFRSAVLWLRGDLDRASFHAQRTMEVSSRHGLLLWEHVGRVIYFTSAGKDKNSRELEVAQAFLEKMMWGVSPLFVSVRVDMLMRAKAFDEAGLVAEKGLAEAHRTGTHVFDPFLYRAKGTIALMTTDHQKGREGARQAFEHSLEIALAQGSTWSALGAAAEIVRLDLKSSRAKAKLQDLRGRIRGGEGLPFLLECDSLLGQE
ncbi:MAG: AAA family ATPase [Leptospirillia bacterium]